MPSLVERAAALLRENDRGTYTVPSAHLYPHQWAWDSAFSAIGWAHLDVDRAVTELETLMAGQWPDGRIPHIIFHDRRGDYFPGPEFWGTERTSSITNPPIWCLAARRILQCGGDAARLRAMLPAFERSHLFFRAARDPERWNLVTTVHPWESGLDNSPAWDDPLRAVDPADAPRFQRVDTGHVGDASQRPTDEDYRRYAVIVKAIAADDFGVGPFQVYDPFLSTLLAHAEAELALLARELGDEGIAVRAAERADAIAAALPRLWSEAEGRYAYHDVIADRRYLPDVIGAYAPLLLGPNEPLERGLRERHWTEWPLATTAPDAPGFEPHRYWRGPSWVNINWLFARVLGDELRERTLEMVERAGFREYFNPLTGDGLGADRFTWTAALVLDWRS